MTPALKPDLFDLLDLPEGLLLKIVKHTCPNGIEDLVLCCKFLYNKSSKLIAEHNANKKKYSILRWPPNSRWNHADTDVVPATQEHPACLSDLLFEPHLAPYVRRLDCLTDYDDRSRTRLKPFPNLPMTTRDPVWREFFDVTKCPYIPEPALRVWSHRLDRCYLESVSALLLAKLPELQDLTMHDVQDGSWIYTMLRGISLANKTVAGYGKQQGALSKLRHVHGLHLSHNAVNNWPLRKLRYPAVGARHHSCFVWRIVRTLAISLANKQYYHT